MPAFASRLFSCRLPAFFLLIYAIYISGSFCRTPRACLRHDAAATAFFAMARDALFFAIHAPRRDAARVPAVAAPSSSCCYAPCHAPIGASRARRCYFLRLPLEVFDYSYDYIFFFF